MLKQLERPEMYIGLEVWYFEKDRDHPVKGKIKTIYAAISADSLEVHKVYLEDVCWFEPNAVFMTREEALSEKLYKLYINRDAIVFSLETRQAVLKSLDADIAAIKKQQGA